MSLHSDVLAKAPELNTSDLPQPTEQGHIPYNIPSIEKECFTFYKVFGDLKCGTPPLIMLHGGPGGGHEGGLILSQLWPLYGIPVIFYDQIGCAGSTHLPETRGDHSFWTLDLFMNELDNLIDYFHLRDGIGFNVFGHSWGGMLGAAWAGTQPRGLQRLVLSSANASKVLSASSCLTLRLLLPPDVQKVLREKEAARQFDDPDYKAAMLEFYKLCLFNGDAPSPESSIGIKHLRDDSTVYATCQGPSLVLNEGSMRTFNAIPNLHKIQAPTLVINGDSDASHDISQEPFFELIPKVRWITLPNAKHAHLNQRELRPRTLKLIGEFLTPAKMEERARQRNWYGDTPRAMPERLPHNYATSNA